MKQKNGVLKRIWKLLVVSMAVALLMGFGAMAAGDKVVDMVPGTNGIFSYGGVEADSQTTVYHRITLPSAGELTVSGYSISALNNHYGLQVALCNSSFQVLDPYTNGAYVNSDISDGEMYGVAKGTYYLKVSGYKTYVLAAQFTAKTDKGGATKKKAASIKQKKTVYGVMAAGEKAKKADWYKFQVTRAKKLQITVGTEGNGYLEFYVYGPSYKSGARLGSMKNEKSTYYSINSLTRKKISVKPGTYYIKVIKSSYSQKGSGVYSLSWKLK